MGIPLLLFDVMRIMIGSFSVDTLWWGGCAALAMGMGGVVGEGRYGEGGKVEGEGVGEQTRPDQKQERIITHEMRCN